MAFHSAHLAKYILTYLSTCFRCCPEPGKMAHIWQTFFKVNIMCIREYNLICSLTNNNLFENCLERLLNETWYLQSEEIFNYSYLYGHKANHPWTLMPLPFFLYRFLFLPPVSPPYLSHSKISPFPHTSPPLISDPS